MIQEITEENCTIAGMHPAAIGEMLNIIVANNITWDGPLIKNIYTGGLPVASSCLKAIGVISDVITNCYASTEAGIIAYDTIAQTHDFIDYSAGYPAGGVEIKVTDKKGFVVKRNKLGFIQVRSPHLFLGYLNSNEKTKHVLSANRWMNTDDIGCMTGDGKIVVSGRASDIILQGGKYHIPSKVEAFLKTHPHVSDAVVIAIPDDHMFELVCACIVPKAGHILTVDDIQQFYDANFISSTDEAYSRLRPAVIEFFETFPKLWTGKVNKPELKNVVKERRKL